jgi:hypothetical protein
MENIPSSHELQSKLRSTLGQITAYYNQTGHQIPSDPKMESRRLRQVLIFSSVIISKYFYRNMIRAEQQHIRDQITKGWTNHTLDLELALVIKTVAYAILNPSK